MVILYIVFAYFLGMVLFHLYNAIIGWFIHPNEDGNPPYVMYIVFWWLVLIILFINFIKSKDHFRHGKYHSNTHTEWWYKDKLHRLNGPAVIYVSVFKAGHKEWWVKGKRIDCSTQKEFKKLIKLKAFM